MPRFTMAAGALRGPFKSLIRMLAVSVRKVLPRKMTAAVRHIGRPDADEARLLTKAVGARDAELLRLKSVRSVDRPATVVGAFNARTGKVAVGHSSPGRRECAEASAARRVGGDVSDIRFTIAKRPTKAGPPFRDVRVCAKYCEPAYGRGAFPEAGTRFESDL